MITTSTNYIYGSYEADRATAVKIAEDDPLYLYGINPADNNASDSALHPKKSDADEHVVIGYGFDFLVNSPSYIISQLQAAGLSFTSTQIATITDTLNAYQATPQTKTNDDVISDLSFIDLGSEATATTLLNNLLDAKESELTTRLAQYGITMGHSRERAALMSMVYNGGTWDEQK